MKVDPFRGRGALAGLGLVLLTAAICPRMPAASGRSPAYWKSRFEDVTAAVREVRTGKTSVLAQSPGGRPVHLVSYGVAERIRGTANFNSAAGGRDLMAYARKDGKQKPVVLLLGPVHGQEFEGIAGLVNLIQVAETGRDHRGREWPELAANIGRCRVLIVPCGNPDGRVRCEFDSWVGEELRVHERAGMGVKPDASNLTWPLVKQIHPMRGQQVAKLGAYWNDAAVNLMHDEWFDPMAPETVAFFRLAREEAPDFIVSLHSHASLPSIEPTAYVPPAVKQTIKAIGDRVQKRYAGAGLPNRGVGPAPIDEGRSFPPPSFNLCSALHHACGAVAFVHESNIGVRTPPYKPVSHDQLLDLQMLLYDELLRFAVETPVSWVR